MARPHAHPFTHTTCFSVCTISTRSRCASITASMSLYAAGVSSMTSLSLRHSTPAVAASWSATVKRLLRRGTRHHAARAVAAALEALGVAQAAHDVRTRTHGARDDSELALLRAHRALAGHEERPRRSDARACSSCGDSSPPPHPSGTAQLLTHHAQHRVHHRARFSAA